MMEDSVMYKDLEKYLDSLEEKTESDIEMEKLRKKLQPEIDRLCREKGLSEESREYLSSNVIFAEWCLKNEDTIDEDLVQEAIETYKKPRY